MKKIKFAGTKSLIKSIYILNRGRRIKVEKEQERKKKKQIERKLN